MRALFTVLAVLTLGLPSTVGGQGRGAAPTQTPNAAAPIDLTGYWVAVVTEDWKYRMVTPTKGDYQGVPMTAEARRIADAWNPEADQAAGAQCKSYGAPALMRVPGRIHITWQDDRTLRLDMDAGTQTRLFRFEPPPGKSAPSWQGDSTARWEALPVGRGADPGPARGWLKVTTTNLKAGYLRKNGVPYSEATGLTEYYDLGTLPNGDQVIVLTSVVEDPRFLAQPFVISTQFKKQADASGWDPTPCSATW
ncbi:MAG: hypothetical protein WBD07_16080 [Vicinamibacterales bacterium]